ncbi:MAG: hypothetical protein M1828_003640 [Chrysothrix sp. TS-e1954]|nr:MAG: hypothetical protein M1828_003640 [Chrysothrix sp. TS-e1954]
MAEKKDQTDDTPVPTTEKDGVVEQTQSDLTAEQWPMLQSILTKVYQHRTEDGYDPSRLFHKKVNKRAIPAYYEIIKEPIALSTIKASIHTKSYKTVREFVRDFALIPHNAQVYNRPDSGAYQDALIIKGLLESELQKLVEKKAISEDDAKLPDLGEIPAPDEGVDEDAEDEDEDDEDDEAEEGAEVKKKRGRGKRTKSQKQDGTASDDNKSEDDADNRKKRNRPPRVDTPTEARIKNIIKALRRIKSTSGQLKVAHFERLPDKQQMPDYFTSIKNPIAVDTLKRKLKRKKYASVDQFMNDVKQMFENAKFYNEDDSQIHKYAVELQDAVELIAAEETSKPDADFAMEDGRLPLPNGIMRGEEHFKIGDWVHIQNANDLSKPIVTQIYRTWQDTSGNEYVNACWYYRPEQTIHRFDKHFYEKEVVKTGQYRDHRIDEVLDRCFVMFITRYSKGRPRDLPPDREIYVCESRYNEEKHTFNKIKTWASCLPDEVRDKDYQMIAFTQQQKLKKVPSPIAYLLKDEQKEEDDLPKPQWGADNAPPKIGAVHKRPRDPKDSPPPQPTPTPSPEPPPPPPAALVQRPPQLPPASTPSNMANGGFTSREKLSSFTATAARPTPIGTPSQPNNPQSYRSQQSANPPHTMPRQTSTTNYSAHTPSTNYPSRAPQQSASSYPAASQRYQPSSTLAAQNYQNPPTPEVWSLTDAANGSIPPDIREQFQCDEGNRVLFWTTPPMDTTPKVEEGPVLGHSARYLAAKLRKGEKLREKRKHEEAMLAEQREKRLKVGSEEMLAKAKATASQALAAWEQRMRSAIEVDYKALYGNEWEKHLGEEMARVRNLGGMGSRAA